MVQEKKSRIQRMTFRKDEEVSIIRKALSVIIRQDTLQMPEQMIAIELYKKVNEAWQKRDPVYDKSR